MGLEKDIKRSEIRYFDDFDIIDDEFKTHPAKFNDTFTDIEDYIVHDDGYHFAIYEVDRMLSFVAIAYCEIKHGELTERMKGELQLDIPVWDSGVVDKFFFDEEEKKLVYEHLSVIKDYIKKHP